MNGAAIRRTADRLIEQLIHIQRTHGELSGNIFTKPDSTWCDPHGSDINAIETFLKRNRILYSKMITTRAYFYKREFEHFDGTPEIPALRVVG